MKKIVSIILIILLFILASNITFAKGELYEEQLIMDDLNEQIKEANFVEHLRIVECRFIGGELLLQFNEEYHDIGEDVFELLEICSIEDAKLVVLYSLE